MAKFGEGDPRWLVQDLGTTNVNNWHWTEKDCTAWAKERLQQIFENLSLVSTDIATAQTTGLESMEGDAFLNVRKNKLIASYELNIKIEWTGSLKDGSGAEVGTAKGSLHFPYLADENHDEDPEFRCICTSEDAASRRLKEAINSAAAKKVCFSFPCFPYSLRMF